MRSLNDIFLTGYLADVSTAGQIYVPIPDTGRLVAAYAARNGTISGGDAVLTLKTAQGTAGTITLAHAADAAGDVDSNTFTANNQVVEGETIEIETNGGSTGTVPVVVTLVVRR